MTGQVGGAYAALMGKKNKNQNQPKADAKPKAAKVLALKDTKDTKAPKKEKEVKKVEEPKKVEKAPERQLTKREQKDERSATDRHHPRAGHAPGHGKKTNEVQDAVDAANEGEIDPAKKEELEARRREYEEKEAARKAEEEAEAKRITYAEYEKQLQEKKADLGVKSLQARKVDAPKKVVALAKKDEEAMEFTKKKTEVAPKKDAKGKQAQQGAPKKKKFGKSDTVQLAFTVAAQPQRERGPRRDNRENRPPRQAAPAPAAEAAQE